MKALFKFLLLIVFSCAGNISIFVPQIIAAQAAAECLVCYDEPADQILPCGHSYCRSCIRGRLDICQREISLADMRCFDPNCRRQLSLEELERMPFAQDLLNLYKQRRAQRDAPQVDPRGWRIPSIAEAKGAVMFYLFVDARPCPQCGILISRNGGCDHMTCTRCHHHYCWHCSRPHNHGYHGCFESKIALYKKSAKAAIAAGAAAGSFVLMKKYIKYKAQQPKKPPYFITTWLKNKLNIAGQAVSQSYGTARARVLSTDYENFIPSAQVGIGLATFAALEALEVNSYSPLARSIIHKVGDERFYDFVGPVMRYANPLYSQIENGRLFNMAIATGVGYVSKFILKKIAKKLDILGKLTKNERFMEILDTQSLKEVTSTKFALEQFRVDVANLKKLNLTKEQMQSYFCVDSIEDLISIIDVCSIGKVAHELIAKYARERNQISLKVYESMLIKLKTFLKDMTQVKFYKEVADLLDAEIELAKNRLDETQIK